MTPKPGPMPAHPLTHPNAELSRLNAVRVRAGRTRLPECRTQLPQRRTRLPERRTREPRAQTAIAERQRAKIIPQPSGQPPTRPGGGPESILSGLGAERGWSENLWTGGVPVDRWVPA